MMAECQDSVALNQFQTQCARCTEMDAMSDELEKACVNLECSKLHDTIPFDDVTVMVIEQ